MGAFKGLKEVLIGTVGTITAESPLPAVLTKLGKVVGDGVTPSESDAEIEELVECGETDPYDYNVSKGKTDFKFQMAVTSIDDLIAAKGGETMAIDNGDGFKEGDSVTLPVKGVKITTTTTGMYFAIPRAYIIAKYAGTLGKKGQLLLEVQIKPMATEVTGVPAVIPVFP